MGVGCTCKTSVVGATEDTAAHRRDRMIEDVLRQQVLYSVYLLYEYKSTKILTPEEQRAMMLSILALQKSVDQLTAERPVPPQQTSVRKNTEPPPPSRSRRLGGMLTYADVC